VHALLDKCPHRGAPLSQGVQRDVTGRPAVHCPYHGWAFDVESGACVSVPALSDADPADARPICAERYGVKERHGLIWIFHDPSQHASAGNATAVPPLPFTLPEKLSVKSLTVVDADGPYDEAVAGLVDAAHTPFVHKQWWWRQGRAAREKTKAYEKLPTGFRMPAHAPSGNSRIYQVLGGKPTTQIDFLLPGVRIETIKTERHLIIGLTAITPVSAFCNRITHALFWTIPVMTIVKPIIDAMAKSFLSQDAAILSAQAQNLVDYKHRPLYLGEPDEPIKWVRQMNKAWRTQIMEQGNADFDNPVSVRTLHWKT